MIGACERLTLFGFARFCDGPMQQEQLQVFERLVRSLDTTGLLFA